MTQEEREELENYIVSNSFLTGKDYALVDGFMVKIDPSDDMIMCVGITEEIYKEVGLSELDPSILPFLDLDKYKSVDSVIVVTADRSELPFDKVERDGIYYSARTLFRDIMSYKNKPFILIVRNFENIYDLNLVNSYDLVYLRDTKYLSSSLQLRSKNKNIIAPVLENIEKSINTGIFNNTEHFNSILYSPRLVSCNTSWETDVKPMTKLFTNSVNIYSKLVNLVPDELYLSDISSNTLDIVRDSLFVRPSHTFVRVSDEYMYYNYSLNSKGSVFYTHRNVFIPDFESCIKCLEKLI